jgi:hypothetical protein
MFSLIVWSWGFDKNWGDDADGHNGGEEGDWVDGGHVSEKHSPVKSVIPVEVLEFKVVDDVTSVIDSVTDV